MGAMREILSVGLPTAEYPSDHLPVAAVFRLSKDSLPVRGLQPPVGISEDVCEEWLMVSAVPQGSGKRAVGEQRKLEKAFLSAVSPEEAESLKAWRAAAAVATTGMMKSVVGRVLFK